jgi:uncharacterized protein
MPSPRKPFRINVGFIAHEEIGRNHDFPFELNKIKLGDDFELRDLSGNVNISRTPQGLFVQADFAADTTLVCVRCLTDYDHHLEWSFTELYAFDERSVTDSGLILPEDGQIDLAELLHDYALLEIPIKPICEENCQGLCIECGQNLNEKDCGHSQEDNASPFGILKDLLK